MNDRSEKEIDDLLLERLVDGELAGAEYRALLAELEQRPDGWRRCAMAFLEDQAWGKELRCARRQLDEPTMKEPIVKPSPKRARRSWHIGGILTLASAASFLLAYFVATAVFQFRDPSIGANPSVATNKNDHRNGIGGPTQPGWENNLVPPLGEYVMGVEGPNQIAMPIFAADDPRGRILLNERASMPVEMLRDLQRSGYEVNRQRQWVVGEEADNSVLVPIEELQITPVSGRSYQ